jgi:flagellar hook-associated protein 1 FlgK
MSSTFSGYSIATSGMYVNQAALSVTSQNLSNINTTGYSRKQIAASETVVQQSSTSVGTGVSVASITRARNQMLDKTYRQENAAAGYWQAKSSNLEEAAVTLNEFTADDGTSDNGLQQTIEEFFSSWEELSKDPSSLSARQSVVDYAQSLVDTLSSIDEQLQAVQLDSAAKVKESVTALNDLATQVAALNQQIKEQELAGAEASDLRDQREELLDNMSALTTVNVREKQDGTVEVTVGGVYLVQGNQTNRLSVTGDGSAEQPLVVRWEDLNQKAQLDGGSIQAYMEDADQSGVTALDPDNLPYAYSADSSSSISNLRQSLNVLLTTVAVAINSLHSTGTGLDGTTGVDFFVPVADSQPLSISNIQVNPELVADRNKIAASASGDAGDNTIATQIAAVASGNLFQYDGLSMDSGDFYQSIIAWLGSAGDTANSYYTNQSALVAQIDNQRQAVLSVSLDEEMSNMIMFQNAYSASARVLSTIDGLVGDMIEELG